MMTDDMELVRAYADHHSEEAFAALVARHVNLVFSVARRQVRDAHLAEEVTQATFIILARKAGSLNPKTILSAWLCRTAQYAASDALRTQHRRQRREHEVHMESGLNASEPESTSETWLRIAPWLDLAMRELGDKDHSAVVLRYFEGKDLKQVGAALGVSENAAKTRVCRATEKLRQFFLRRGITLSVGAIGAVISAHSVQAAPLGLATTVTVAALKGTAVTTSTLTLINSTLKIMAWTKLKTAVLVGTLVVIAAGTATVGLQQRRPTATPAAFAFSGYATPEATLTSMLWAGSKGDFDQAMRSCTSEQAARIRSKLAGLSPAEVRRETISWANALKDLKIVRTEVISAEEVRLHLQATPSDKGLRRGKSILVMQRIGSEWKQAGEAE